MAMDEHKDLEQRDVLIQQLADYARISDLIVGLLVARAELRKTMIYNGLLPEEPCTETFTSVPRPIASTKQ
jgi:hypothetical protein